MVWANFVHTADLGHSTTTAHRRRALILALPHTGQWTPISAITRLTPDLATLYAGKHRKMLTRDINCLAKAGLLVRHEQTVRPHLEQMFSLLPIRKLTEPEILATLAAASRPLRDSAVP